MKCLLSLVNIFFFVALIFTGCSNPSTPPNPQQGTIYYGLAPGTNYTIDTLVLVNGVLDSDYVTDHISYWAHYPLKLSLYPTNPLEVDYPFGYTPFAFDTSFEPLTFSWSSSKDTICRAYILSKGKSDEFIFYIRNK